MPPPAFRSGANGTALSTASAVSVSNSTADTQILSYLAPANSLVGTTAGFLGQGFIAECVGNSDNVITAAPILSVFLKIVPAGTTFALGSKAATISWTTPTTATTNKPWWARFLLTVRSTGTSGTVGVSGFGYSAAPATPIGAFSWGATIGAGTAVNTTVANTIYLGMGWSAQNASNVLRADQAMIYPVASGVTSP